jgi:hypothetical protein
MRRRSRVAVAAALGASAVLVWAGPARAADPSCVGDGTSGKRVQAIYGHVDGETVDPNAQSLITAWAGEIERTFDVSSRKTGGPTAFARPRWLFTGACGSPGSVLSVQQIDVGNVGMSFTSLRIAMGANPADPTFGAVAATPAANHDRKYLVFLDLASCGGPTSDFFPDTDPNPDTNTSNQNPGTGFDRAMLARYCHGSWSTPPAPTTVNFGLPHELVHMLGGVNPAAPHGYFGHCWDQYDVMCTSADPAHPAVFSCTTGFEGLDVQLLLDCNNDDYFSMKPAAGSYLAGNWNTASSRFLETSGVVNPPPTPPAGTGQPGAAKKKCKKKKKHHRAAAAKKKCKKKKKHS